LVGVDALVQYLNDPIAAGVNNLKCVVDFSTLKAFLENLAEKEAPPRGYRFERLTARIGLLGGTDVGSDEYLETLPMVLEDFALYCEECPKEMKEFFIVTKERTHPVTGKPIVSHIRRRGRRIFDSHLVHKVKDIVHISKEYLGDMRWLFDVTSLTENGVGEFKKCVGAIPPVQNTFTVLQEGRRFSTRFTFKPYSLAVKLWLGDSDSLGVPSDLKSFLSGAVDYIDDEEWRTSIVLSAIAVESILADLYEEYYKKPAPDVPLGDLFRMVKDKIAFPDGTISSIELTNKARIAAVHRSRLPVSQRESVNALFGAVNFARWHAYDSHLANVR
jgi:hypothetical protein